MATDPLGAASSIDLLQYPDASGSNHFQEVGWALKRDGQSRLELFSAIERRAVTRMREKKRSIDSTPMRILRIGLVLPAFEVALLRILTDRGNEYCGKVEQHDYQLYPAVNDIDHTRIKARSPQTNGICERFHKTTLNEFYQVAFRKKVYSSLEELQADLDAWLDVYNHETGAAPRAPGHMGSLPCVR